MKGTVPKRISLHFFLEPVGRLSSPAWGPAASLWQPWITRGIDRWELCHWEWGTCGQRVAVCVCVCVCVCVWIHKNPDPILTFICVSIASIFCACWDTMVLVSYTGCSCSDIVAFPPSGTVRSIAALSAERGKGAHNNELLQVCTERDGDHTHLRTSSPPTDGECLTLLFWCVISRKQGRRRLHHLTSSCPPHSLHQWSAGQPSEPQTWGETSTARALQCTCTMRGRKKTGS